MNYWLVKSEPSTYSWQQLLADGKTNWDGVRNFAARLNLIAMKKGDKVLYYHSNEGLDIVGIAEVSKESFPDATSDDPRWVSVELKPVKAMKKSVTLSTLKERKELQNMQLVRIGRLSVSAVTEKEFDIIMQLGGMKK